MADRPSHPQVPIVYKIVVHSHVPGIQKQRDKWHETVGTYGEDCHIDKQYTHCM